MGRFRTEAPVDTSGQHSTNAIPNTLFSRLLGVHSRAAEWEELGLDRIFLGTGLQARWGEVGRAMGLQDRK